MGTLADVQGLTVQFPNGSLALERVALSVREGKMVVLLGPSGAGKSTLLKAIFAPEALRRLGYTVGWSGRVVTGEPAYVPQRGALLDHLDAADNFKLAQAACGAEPNSSRSPAMRPRALPILMLLPWAHLGPATSNLLHGSVNRIHWFQSAAFCIWDGGFLPSEAERNYAAAGGSEQRQYPWGAAVPGANASLAVYGCYFNGVGNCTGVTNIAPVGSVAAGNGRYGQADLAGNVFEWNLDWYSAYAASCNNCTNSAVALYRVVRGGSFYHEALYLLSSRRDNYSPDARGNVVNHVGLRCARTP